MLRKIKIWIAVITVITIIGCDKEFLETKPTNSISASDALATPANIKLVLNGLHRQLFSQSPIPGGSSSRAGEHYWIPMFDVLVGGVIHSAPANGWMTPELQWNAHTVATTTTVTQLWYQRYHFIASTNAIIKKVADDGLVIDEEMSNMLGQAHAYRAWAYHKLVTTYAKGYLIGNPASDPGVPLLFSSDPPFMSEPRSTVEEIYNQIEIDINQAIDYFQDASAPDDKSHISINAAYGIKARIALSKGDWETAAAAAASARDGFTLMDSDQWLSGFNTVDLSEVIWGGNVIDTETTYYRSYFYYISPTFNGSQNRGNPKLFDKEMYHKIPATDFRRTVALPLAPNTNSAASNGEGGGFATDPNYDNEADFNDAKDKIIKRIGTTNRHNLHPYMHVKFLNKNPGTIDPDDVIYMRAAEMYLIEAEAEAMLGNLAAAQAALRVFGKSRDTAYDETVFDTKELLMEHIRFQRYVELYGEGFGWTDHIRWDRGIDLTNSGASKVLYNDGFKQDKPSVNPKWLWKIPQAEIDANPNISEADQNKY